MVQVDAQSVPRSGAPAIKCVIWDLDNTLWQGTLLEGDEISVSDMVRAVVATLDQRGILQSIASKNDFKHAWTKLVGLGLDQYFLYPQINWSNKSDSVQIIARELGIGLDACAVIDDQPFERDEIGFFCPQVRTIGPARLDRLLEMKQLQPRFVTDEAVNRRSMYQADLVRRRSEESFDGTRDQFLASLAMRMTIRRAAAEDLDRAEELTVRTNQLNTTGRTYSHDELSALLDSPDHLLLVAQLQDRHGSSGTIGLALLTSNSEGWTIGLLIMSCRVITRGVGTIMISHILQRASAEGARVRAEFIPTERNRAMYVTYRFSGFREISETGSRILLEHDLRRIPPFPGYVDVQGDKGWR